MADLWWKDFFNGLIVDFWRVAMTPEVTRAEAEFLVRRLALGPSPVPDACSTSPAATGGLPSLSPNGVAG